MIHLVVVTSEGDRSRISLSVSMIRAMIQLVEGPVDPARMRVGLRSRLAVVGRQLAYRKENNTYALTVLGYEVLLCLNLIPGSSPHSPGSRTITRRSMNSKRDDGVMEEVVRRAKQAAQVLVNSVPNPLQVKSWCTEAWDRDSKDLNLDDELRPLAWEVYIRILRRTVSDLTLLTED
jgi:hypothetical protein